MTPLDRHTEVIDPHEGVMSTSGTPRATTFGQLSIPMRGNEVPDLSPLGSGMKLSIPMRGNEVYVTLSTGCSLSELSIPMRGNECSSKVWLHMPMRLSIPMRGNESIGAGNTAPIHIVIDPHEG